MALCLNPDIIKEVKKYKLEETKSTDQRLAIFRRFTTEKNAVDLTKQYERSLLLQNRDTAYEKFIRNIGDGKGKSPDSKTAEEVRLAVKERLAERKALIEANPEQFEAILKQTDLQIEEIVQKAVKKKFGVDLPPDVEKKLVELSTTIKKTKEAVGDNLGSIDKVEETIAFIKARKTLDEYVQSIRPSSNTDVFIGNIGKGAMLASPKGILFNIESNAVTGVAEYISKRIANGQTRGTSSTLVKQYRDMADKIYDETGFDISRATSFKDSGLDGARVLDETVSSQGKGDIRAISRAVQKIVFKKGLGKPDNMFANFAFIDTVNLLSKKMAKKKMKLLMADENAVLGDLPTEQALAESIMKDAMLIEPKTDSGKILRAQAILDAEVATMTNASWSSKLSKLIRNLLNTATGTKRTGDLLMPFIKAPANYIETGADYAGLGAVKAAFKTVQAWKGGKLKDPTVIKQIATDATRSGVGIATALGITSLFDDEDFVGAYDPKRAQIEGLKNSNYNAIKIGDKWVSVELFGPLAVPITAIMYQRQGKGYIKGVGSQFLNIPGLDAIKDTVYGGYTKALESSSGENLKDASQYTIEELTARIVPSFFLDAAKATDRYQRDTKGSLIGTVQSKIPGWRNQLPAKTTVFGEKRKDENFLMDILIGSRVKTDRSTPVITEIDRVTRATKTSTTFTDWSKTSSKEVAQFKEKVGEDRFNEAKLVYGKKLESELTKLFKSPTYIMLSDAEKLKQIAKQDDQAKEATFRQFGFKYRQEKTKDYNL